MSNKRKQTEADSQRTDDGQAISGLEPRIIMLENVILLQLIVPPNGPDAEIAGQFSFPHHIAREIGCTLITAATVALSSASEANQIAIVQAQHEADRVKLKS